MPPDRQTYSSEETTVRFANIERRLSQLEHLVSDHDQRFDTLQTPWWRRVRFWLEGWPWYDLNGERQRRPWHRGPR